MASLTVGAYAAQYLARRRVTVRPNTYRSDERLLRLYVLAHELDDGRHLADLSLEAVGRGIIADLVAGLLRAGYARGTARIALAALRSLLGEATYVDGLLTANPAEGLSAHLFKHVRRPPFAREPVREDAVSPFLAAVARVAPRFAVLFLTLARTGLRIGEAVGLQWEDVDFARRKIDVRRTWTFAAFGDPKGGAVGEIDMSQELARALAAHRASAVSRWCFPSPLRRDLPYHPSHVARMMKLALAAAGLPLDWSPHSFRHGLATALLDRPEVPMRYVQRQLRHSAIGVTVGLYGRRSRVRGHFVDLLDGGGQHARKPS